MQYKNKYYVCLLEVDNFSIKGFNLIHINIKIS